MMWKWKISKLKFYSRAVAKHTKRLEFTGVRMNPEHPKLKPLSCHSLPLSGGGHTGQVFEHCCCQQIISVLPQCHRNVFNYLTAFLQELLKHAAHNRLDASVLGPIFAVLLLRSPTKQDLTEKRKVKEFLQHFLVLTPSDRDIHDKPPQ